MPAYACLSRATTCFTGCRLRLRAQLAAMACSMRVCERVDEWLQALTEFEAQLSALRIRHQEERDERA